MGDQRATGYSFGTFEPVGGIHYFHVRTVDFSGGLSKTTHFRVNIGQGVATVTTPTPVPYAWLDQYPVLLGQAGGDYEVVAWADADLDGMLTWQEYVAGSIPTNSDSVFRFLISVSNSMP